MILRRFISCALVIFLCINRGEAQSFERAVARPTCFGMQALEVADPWVGHFLLKNKRIFYVIAVTLIMAAFAANSDVARIAQKPLPHHQTSLIDPATYSFIRVLTGALSASLVKLIRERTLDIKKGDMKSGFFLFAYMVAFSFGYVGLAAGTGALIMFFFVHATILITGHIRGHPLSFKDAVGLIGE